MACVCSREQLMGWDPATLGSALGDPKQGPTVFLYVPHLEWDLVRNLESM